MQVSSQWKLTNHCQSRFLAQKVLIWALWRFWKRPMMSLPMRHTQHTLSRSFQSLSYAVAVLTNHELQGP